MAEVNLATIIDAFVEMSDEAIATELELTCEQVETAILIRWPEAAPILDLAFERAEKRISFGGTMRRLKGSGERRGQNPCIRGCPVPPDTSVPMPV